ncbi:DUF167 domain-containing protein [Lyngbya sp. PCC 8106]|uniref:DUF167 domain-containing protein n=1 Tax=Lyngbya sp. (strain PCC 8106) TaxID=313612 RepID=UPI0000EAD456|nr:DUF167 domain-containing protein [Lyngbya sp. PCC 8106]EAW33834.1 hypothetical protein L8106_18212 [Lyngbya sp. PCC 8106]
MVVLHVKVKPNSKQQSMVKNEEGTYIIHLKSPPIDGKANQELIKILAKQFNIPKSQVSIKSGLSSKNKLIELPDSCIISEN